MVDIIKKYSPIPLTDTQLSQMEAVYEKLEEKNKVMNLTSIKSGEEAAELHFVDSLNPLSTGLVKGEVLDVGSGGGFPGFPVAIASGARVTCLDATRKKLDFIEETASELGIGNIDVLFGRAEELGLDKAYRDRFDTVLSRGVARLNVLCEWCMPFVRKNGYFIAMKGPSAGEEVEEAKNAIKTLGGELVDIINYKLQISGHEHALIIIKKTAATPPGYPRRNAVIQKKPL